MLTASSPLVVLIHRSPLELKTRFKWPSTAFVALGGILIASSFMSAKRLHARPATGQAQSQERLVAQSSQTAAAPQQLQESPRTTLAGSWTLNREQSDDPRQKVRAAESSSNGAPNGYPGGGNPGGNYPGGGYPDGYPGGNPGSGFPGGGRRGGYPPAGGGPYGGQQNTGLDIESNPQMQPLIHPSGLLTIELRNPEIDVTDEDSHKLTLYTDGRKLQKSKSNDNQEVAAHWVQSQLVSDEKSPLGGRMSRTFQLSRDGRQLFETLHIDIGRSDTPLVIRYVYDTAGSDTESEPDSDPNRPVLKKNPDGGSQ